MIFTRFNERVNWTTAKSRCEAVGQTLAVLDTEEKRTALHVQRMYSFCGFIRIFNKKLFRRSNLMKVCLTV